MIRRFRKLSAVLLAAMMLAAMTACGDKGAELPDTYQYDDLSQYITLASYEGLEYTEADTTVTDEEVQEYIDQVIQSSISEQDITEGEVTKDSIVKVDFTGKIDGEEFSGGTAVDYQINMATDTFIDGFKEGILGHQVGDTFDLNLKFPDDYGNADVAGKDVVFTITVKALVETVVPEFNDEFVKANSDFETTAEYEADVRSSIEENKAESARSSQMSQLFSQILSGSEVVEYPETELNAAIEDMKTTYTNLAQTYGIEYADYLENYLGMTEEEFDEQVTTSAQNQVKQQLVLRALAKELGVEISRADYNDFLAELLEEAGFTEESFEEYSGMTIVDYAEQNDLYSSMLYEKTMEKVLEMSTAVPAEKEAADDSEDKQ